MATTLQGGSGIPLIQPALYQSAPFSISNYNSYKTNTNMLALGSGETEIIPAGQWLVTVGLYTLTVPVTITDTRVMIGRAESLVSPVGGSGTAWVSDNRLSPLNGGTA